MTEKKIDLAEINAEAGTSTRVKLSEQAIADYEENYKNGVAMPPIRVFKVKDIEGYVLTRGFHRNLGAKKAGLTQIMAEVFKGTLDEAKEDALGSNAEHGVQRTPEDKRQEVMLALTLPQLAQQTDRAIAEKCKVSNHLVAKIRGELGGDVTPAEETATTPGAEGAKGGDGASEAGAAPKPKVKVGRDGKKYRQKPKAARKLAGNRFCDRCTRVGPVKDCAKCKELNGGKAPAGKPAAAAQAEPKNGEPVFSLQEFKRHAGAALRECYKLVREYKHLLPADEKKEPPELMKVRAQVAKLMKDVGAWREKLLARAKKAKATAKA